MDRRVIGFGWPLIAVLAALAMISLAWAGTKAIQASDDLMRRAEEVRLFLRGANPYRIPDMTYPPSALAVFVPLVAPLAESGTQLRFAWLGWNLAALAVVAWLLVRLWGPGWPPVLKLAFVLAVAASKPVRGGIGLGQFHLIPLAAMLLAVQAYQRKRPAAAGCWIAVALVKPTMALPFLAFWLVRRQWRAVAVALALHAAALATVSAWTRTTPWRLLGDWLANARTQEAAGTLDIPSLCERAWPQVLPASWISLAILAATMVLVWCLRKRSDASLVSLTLCLAAIFSYHRHYDLVLLLPAFALAVNDAWQSRGPARVLLVVLAAALALLIMAPSHPSVTGSLERVYDQFFPPAVYVLLGLLFGSVMWDGRPCRCRRQPHHETRLPMQNRLGGWDRPHSMEPSASSKETARGGLAGETRL